MFILILKAAGLLLALGLLFAVLIVFLSKKLTTEQDPRIDEVKACLTGANCGACGYAGCEALAKAIVAGAADVNRCPSASAENKKLINALIGSAAEVSERTAALVYCNGGNACREKYAYQGYGDCRSAELLSGGRKACYTGCIGLASCVDSCPHFAVEVNQKGYSEIDRKKCVSCGQCIAACPKALIRRVRASARVYCACSNTGRGKEVKEVCASGCIGCTLCAGVCPSGAIVMENNLPVFDYDKCTACLKCAERCPQKCIKTL
jgi:electron transport complex protein RnfB